MPVWNIIDFYSKALFKYWIQMHILNLLRYIDSTSNTKIVTSHGVCYSNYVLSNTLSVHKSYHSWTFTDNSLTQTNSYNVMFITYRPFQEKLPNNFIYLFSTNIMSKNATMHSWNNTLHELRSALRYIHIKQSSLLKRD